MNDKLKFIKSICNAYDLTISVRQIQFKRRNLYTIQDDRDMICIEEKLADAERILYGFVKGLEYAERKKRNKLIIVTSEGKGVNNA